MTNLKYQSSGLWNKKWYFFLKCNSNVSILTTSNPFCRVLQENNLLPLFENRAKVRSLDDLFVQISFYQQFRKCTINSIITVNNVALKHRKKGEKQGILPLDERCKSSKALNTTLLRKRNVFPKNLMFSDLNVHRARLYYDEGWYIDKSIDLQGVRENEVQLLRGNDHTSVITR